MTKPGLDQPGGKCELIECETDDFREKSKRREMYGYDGGIKIDIHSAGSRTGKENI